MSKGRICVNEILCGNVLETTTSGGVTIDHETKILANLEMTVGQITFGNGIEIGNTTTNTSDSTAIAVGKGANAGGINSIAVGVNAMSGNVSTGIENIAIGYKSAFNLTTGQRNIAVGANALSSITTTDNNIVIGHDAAKNNNSSKSMVVIGANAHSSFVNGGGGESDYDVIIGYNAAANQVYNYGGRPSVVLGGKAAEQTTYFASSVILGYNAWKYQNMTGGSNQFIQNVVIGSDAGKSGMG